MHPIPPSPTLSESGPAHDDVFIADLQLVIQWDLAPTAAQLLMESSEQRSVRCGEVVLRQGDICPGLYFVLAGEVHAVDQAEGKRAKPLYSLRSGDVFGEGALQHQMALSSIQAGPSCRILFVPAERLDRIMNRIPITTFVFKRLKLRIKSVQMSAKTPRQRSQTLH